MANSLFNSQPVRISELSRGARLIFEENPYCILGLPCTADRKTALDRADKLAKLSRLSASGSFVSDFDLPDVERPDRDLGTVQVALSRLDQLDHVWLWFADSAVPRDWRIRRDRRWFTSSDSYDGFLACYLLALITDPTFRDAALWTHVVGRIDGYMKMGAGELYLVLSPHLSAENRETYRLESILRSFRRTVEKPLLAALNELDGQSILQLWDSRSAPAVLKERYGEDLRKRLLDWVDEKLVPIGDIIEKYNALNGAKTPPALAEEALRALRDFTEKHLPVCFAMERLLDPATAGMMMQKVKKAFYFGTNPLLTGGKKVEACRYESLVYKYCTTFEKQQIKNHSPMEHLDIPDSEFTAEECFRISLKFSCTGEGARPDLYYLWSRRAADRGHAGGANNVGYCFDWGYGCTKNKETALSWYRKAARIGSEVAWSNLAVYYRGGVAGLTRSDEKSIGCLIVAHLLEPSGKYTEALDKNHPDWKKSFAERYGFEFDADRAKLKRLAKKDNAQAQCLLGAALFKGADEAKTDRGEARRLLLRASLGGCGWASPLLKAFFDIDDMEAEADGRAMYDLALAYDRKDDPQSKDLAFFWYSRAVLCGYSHALNDLGVCLKDGIGTDIDLKRAADCFRRAVESDPSNRVALYNWGRALLLGEGVARDPGLAKWMLSRSAKQGFTKAAEFLEKNFNGIGSEDFDYEELSVCVSDAVKTDSGVSVTFRVSNSDDRGYELWACSIRSGPFSAVPLSRRIVGLTGNFDAVIGIPLVFDAVADSLDLTVEVRDGRGKVLYTSPFLSLDITSDTGPDGRVSLFT